MRVEEIMSVPVVFTNPTIKVKHLKDTLGRKGINAVPVLEKDGTIAGIITSHDLVHCHNESQLVKELMSPKVHISLKNNRVIDTAKTMVKHGVHHMVVMEDGKIVGMISSMDILKVYIKQ